MSTISKLFLCLLTLSLFVSLFAFAGDRYLGTIVSAMNSDGGVLSRNNSVTDASYSSFVIPSNALLDIQCTQGAYVGTYNRSDAGVTSAIGTLVPVDYLFPTSVDSPGYVAIISTDGGSTSCKVFERRGNE